MRVPTYALLWTVAVLFSSAIFLPHTAAGAGAQAVTAPERLAATFGRQALQMLALEPLTPSAIATARILLDEAVELAPNDEHLWRLQLEMALLIEDDARKVHAVRRLRELAPDDEVIQLRSLQIRIDRHQTASERIAAYEEILRRDRRGRLSPAVASRLAYDLALLHQRLGHTSAFATWLGEAIALDQSNHEAAAVAAGFFSQHLGRDDPFAEAELFVNLLLAHPVNRTNQTLLANHLLDHGAYAAATRIFSMIMSQTDQHLLVREEQLVADAAVAFWGAGRDQEAVRTIRRYQRYLNDYHRATVRQEHPEITPLELARHRAVLPTPVAVAYAAIAREGDSEHMESAMAELSRSYQSRIAQYEEDEEESQADHSTSIAASHLELAWMLFWLDGDLELARTHIELAQERRELSEHAVQRFDGWLALREGSTGRAIELLQPLAEDDAAAAAGYALALEAADRRQSAARELLSLARSQPGTLIGVWSVDRLYRLLGRRASLDALARELDALVNTIPASIDRLAEHPRAAASIRVRPIQTTFGSYEPIIIEIELANHLPIPLAIGPESPISPHVVLLPAIEIAGMRTPERLPPIIVPIDRRLTLQPRQRLTIPVDIRRYVTGALQETRPLPGAMMRVRAVFNFWISEYGVVQPGLLGSDHETPVFRIDGVRITNQWFSDMLSMLTNADQQPDVVQMALLSHVIARDPRTFPNETERQHLRELHQAFREAFTRLRASEQAWLLTAMPFAEAFEPVWDHVRSSDHRLVHLTYLLSAAVGDDDPVVLAARRSDDPNLRELGEVAARMRERIREQEELELLPQRRGDLPREPATWQ